jgi:PAS domain S-box-containing protein
MAVSYTVTMFFFSLSTPPFPLCPLGGVGLAMVVLFAFRGRAEMATVLVGLGLAQFFSALCVGVSLHASIAYGFEQPFTVLLGGWLLQRVGFRPTFESVRDVVLLIFCGALVVPLSSYIVHRVSFYYLFDIYPRDPRERPWDFWNFIFTDGNAVLLLTPFLLFVAQRRRFFEKAQAREAGLLFLAITAVVALLFFTPPFLVPFQGTLAYIAFPGLIWASLRFGLPGVSAVLVIHAVEALLGSRWGVLPFQSGTPKHDFMAFQFFLATTSLTGLLLGTVSQERRSFLDRLQKSEGELQALLDFSPMPILMKDLDGRLLLANRAFERLMHSTDLRGHTIEELSPHSSHPEVSHDETWIEAAKRTDEEVLSTLRATTFETHTRGPKGTIHFSVTKFPVFDLDGEIKAIAAISQDTTERHRLEDQLRQSQKMEAIGQLAGGVAHDFNNILTAFGLGLGELRADRELPARLQKLVYELQEQTERATSLTRQLLMFGRRSIMDIKPTRLPGVVKGVLKMLRPLLGERIEIAFHSEDALPWVEADTGMMEQIIVNLAVNARDAMPDGGRLSIELHAVKIDGEAAAAHPGGRDGDFVRLSVRDTGQGIDAAVMSQIFDPFFTTKEVGKGTGLGLATVYGIVEQHQGWIEVESEVGKGTQFSVYLPAKEGALPADEIVPPPIPRQVCTGTETILLVEDEPLVRKKMATALGAAGYHVLTASDGLEATTLWAEYGPGVDLLLTDMIMPRGMTGLDLARKFRQERPELQVIVSSGYSVEQVKRDLAEDDVTHLQKPFRARDLTALVRQCIDNARKSPAHVGEPAA